MSAALGGGPGPSVAGDSARPGNPPGAKGGHSASRKLAAQQPTMNLADFRQPLTPAAHYTFGASKDESSDAPLASGAGVGVH
jgi:hypothetical protein